MPQSARSLDNRFSKASSFFGRLSKRVRQSHSLCLSTKFYPGIQSRHRSHLPVRCRDLGSLSEADRAACVVSRTLLAPHPWQQMTRLRVNRRSPRESQSAQHRAQVLQVQLPWAGHVTRVEDVHMPKAVFFSELQEGKRDRGAPRKRYKDQLKRQLAQAGISHQSWHQEAPDLESWHSSMRKASGKFEAERHEASKERRRRQKEGAASQSSSVQTFACPKCSRVCASRIGLYSHHRVCKN